MYDIAIIGAGPAGLTCGIYAARAGLSALLLERQFAGGQITSTHLLENYPGFAEGIAGMDFSMALAAQAQRFGVAPEAREATGIERRADGSFFVQTGEGGFEARTVVLALGAQPRKLGLPREEEFTGAGVSYCATCDGAFFKNRTVVVVGGGDTALEDALYLSNLAQKVFVMHRRIELRAQQVLADRARARENIEFLLNKRPVELLGGLDFEGVAYEDVQTGERGQLNVDGCFVAVGYVPDVKLAADLVARDAQGYIVAGENCKTSCPGIFVAGDTRTKPLRQVVTAAADGAVAAAMAREYLQNA